MDDELHNAIRLSRSMLDAVGSQSWERLADLDEQRRSLIEHYYGQQQSVDADRTRELKLLNDRIVEQLLIAQEQTRQLQLQLRKGNRATRVYLDVADK